MEYRFTNQPQEAVQPRPELAQVAQGFGAVLEQVQAVNAVAKAEDQAAGNQRGDNRREDFSERAHNPLERALVLLGGALDRVLGHALNPGHRDKIVVKIGNRVANNHLELSRLGERPLDHLHFFDAGDIRLFRVVQYEPHPRDAVRYRRDVCLAPDQL